MINIKNGISCWSDFSRFKSLFCTIYNRKYQIKNPQRQSANDSLKYLLILDFEATCDGPNNLKVQEIIEFPCLKVNAKTLEEESRFHHYVKPIVNTKLTPFCTDLTGIIQDMIENEKTFPEIFKEFEEWRKNENITEENSLYVTSGDWDLGYMLPEQLKLSNIPIPGHVRHWINIKKTFAYVKKRFPMALLDVLTGLDLEFQGRAHSGIVDCINIHNAVKKLALEHNVIFRPTSQLIETEVGLRVFKYS